MKRKKEYQTLPIVEFVNTAEARSTVEMQDISNADTMMDLISDPRMAHLMPHPDMTSLDTMVTLYMVNRWKKNGRAVYRFAEDFINDIRYTELPELKLSEVKFPFDTYCFDFSNNEIYANDGRRVYAALIHYESCTNTMVEKYKRSPIVESMKEMEGLVKDDEQRAMVHQVRKSLFFDKFEKITFRLILQPYGKYIAGDISPSSLHVPMNEMPELGNGFTNGDSDLLRLLLFLMLYVASEEPDLHLSEETKKYYKPTEKVKNTSVKVQDVGYHYMIEKKRRAEERSAKAESQAIVGKAGTPKRPHMRKGHFSIYHVGIGRRDIVTRWIAPIMVHADEAKLNESITIRLVKQEENL